MRLTTETSSGIYVASAFIADGTSGSSKCTSPESPTPAQVSDLINKLLAFRIHDAGEPTTRNGGLRLAIYVT